jgi:Transposase
MVRKARGATYLSRVSSSATRSKAMGKINERCAGIDVGKRFLLCCVLTGAANEEPSTRTLCFDTTVAALTRLREWLLAERITHVVMESTGSYWVPIFNILEDHFGLAALL